MVLEWGDRGDPDEIDRVSVSGSQPPGIHLEAQPGGRDEEFHQGDLRVLPDLRAQHVPDVRTTCSLGTSVSW